METLILYSKPFHHPKSTERSSQNHYTKSFLLIHLFLMHAFCNPWKHQKTLRLCSQGVEKGYTGNKWVKDFFSKREPVHRKLRIMLQVLRKHYMKSFQIRSSFWSVFSCIWTEYRKIRTRKNPVFGHFSRSDTFNGNLIWCCIIIYLNLILYLYDTKFNVLNFRHKILCEVSPHVLYQYIFIIFWFLFNMGILIASIGFISHICKHIRMMDCRFKSGLTEASLITEIYTSLTFREIEYL